MKSSYQSRDLSPMNSEDLFFKENMQYISLQRLPISLGDSPGGVLAFGVQLFDFLCFIEQNHCSCKCTKEFHSAISLIASRDKNVHGNFG